MDYTVELRIDKRKYDRKWIFGKNIPIFEWLYDNIGNSDISGTSLDEVKWSHPRLRYDGPDVISIYKFRYASDATLFALKWQKDDLET